MSDIKTFFVDMTQGADFGVDGLGLVQDDGLESAVIISLVTDRLATADDIIPDGGTDRRGWWGDSYADIQNDLLGSRLWLLGRSKQLASVLQLARQYALEALNWLVDDGVAGSVDVVASNPQSSVLALHVSIYRPGKPVVQYLFKSFWGGG